MATPRIGRTLLAAVMVGILTVPYARPVVCEGGGHHHDAAAAMADAHPSGWTMQADGAARCHELMACGVVPVAPTLEGGQATPTMQKTVQQALPRQQSPASLLTPPLTPPPRA